MDPDRGEVTGGEDFKSVLGEELTRAHEELYGNEDGEYRGLTVLEWIWAVLVTVAAAGVTVGFYEMIGWFASW